MNSDKDLSIDELPFAIFCLSDDGVIKQCNRLAQTLCKITSNDLVNTLFASLLTESSAKSLHTSLGSFTACVDSAVLSTTCQIEFKDLPSINHQAKLTKSNHSTLLYIESPVNESIQCPGAPEAFFSQVTQKNCAYWEWDIESNRMYYSAALMGLLGYSHEAKESGHSLWQNLIAKSVVRGIKRQIILHLRNELPCLQLTFELITPKGKKLWVNLSGKCFTFEAGKTLKMFGAVEDITKHQTLLEQLDTQNGYLNLAEKLSRSGHWRYEITTQNLYWSDGIYSIHGVSPQTFKPNVEQAIEFYVEHDREMVRACLDAAVEQQQGFHYKSAIVLASGKKVKVESLGDVEVNNDGDVVAVFGVFKDITKSEETFEKLKLLAMVNYTIKVPIFFIDDQDNIVYQDLSPQSGEQNEVLFNYINFSIKDYLNFKQTAKEQGQVKHQGISFDKYNTIFDLSVTYEAEEGIYIWIVENVTEKFRKEQQQIISNRLALLGNTFGTVSHDINNVLGVALGATEMLEMKIARGEQDVSKYVERVKNAIDKGKNVTERLLAFTRKPTVKVVEFDPVKEIEENLYLFKQLLLSTIEFEFNKQDIACLVTFPQGEFINIILNIVLNAQDAIREEKLIGKIEMTVALHSDDAIEIKVKDSGVGIKEENLSKIFDPFYSSKSRNKGNGIGLANVYNTMYKHNGEIHVAGQSDLGGAEFTLIFKCKLQPKSNSTAVPRKTSSLGLEEKSVLIVDDEVSIAEFVALFLDGEGAHTTHVTNKADLESTLNRGTHVDILITDMILPDISGRDTVNMVKARFPDVKVYSMSGYIAEEITSWHYPVLRKPFNSKELATFLVNN